MADQTHIIIDGARFEGSRAESLPKWATDQVLREIQKDVSDLVTKLLRRQQGSGKKLEDNTKSINNFAKKLSDTRSGKDPESLSRKEQFERFKTHSESTVYALERIRASFSGGMTDFSSIMSAVFNFNDVSSGFGGMFRNVLNVKSALFVLGSALGKGADIVAKLTRTELELYDSGIAFQNNLFELTGSAGQAHMTLSGFSEMILKNTALIKALNGVKGYAGVLRQVQDLAKSNHFYGMTLKGLNEYTSEYLEIYRRTGVMQRLSHQDQSIAIDRSIKEMTQFSHVMGKSRKQMIDEIANATKRTDWSSYIRTLNKQQLEAANTALNASSAFFGEAGAIMVANTQDLLARQDGIVSDFWIGVQSLSPGLYQYAAQTKALQDAGQLSASKMQERMTVLAEGFRDLPGLTDEYKLQLAGVNHSLSQQIDSVFQVRDANQGFSREQLKINNALTPLTGSVKDLENKWREFTSILESESFRVFESHMAGFAIQVAKALKWFVEGLMEAPDALKQFLSDVGLIVTDLLPKAIWEAITSNLSGAWDSLKNLFDFSSEKQMLVDGIRGLVDMMIETFDKMLYKASFGHFGRSEEMIRADKIKMSQNNNGSLLSSPHTTTLQPTTNISVPAANGTTTILNTTNARLSSNAPNDATSSSQILQATVTALQQQNDLLSKIATESEKSNKNLKDVNRAVKADPNRL